MKIPDSVGNLVFVLSLAAFTLGFVLHGLTYFGIDARDSVPITWYTFQIGTALALIPIIIINRRRHEQREQRPPQPLDKFRQILGLVFSLSVVYLVFTFVFTGMVLLHNQSPEMVNGNYAMGSHGMFHTLTKAEFFKYRVYEARMNSSHWMALCSLISWELLDYLIRRPRAVSA
jgi:hypothetical protein